MHTRGHRRQCGKGQGGVSDWVEGAKEGREWRTSVIVSTIKKGKQYVYKFKKTPSYNCAHITEKEYYVFIDNYMCTK